MAVVWNGADPKECAWAEAELRRQTLMHVHAGERPDLRLRSDGRVVRASDGSEYYPEAEHSRMRFTAGFVVGLVVGSFLALLVFGRIFTWLIY